MIPENRKTVGVALGCGSARGWSHIGVLRALQAHGIPVDFVAGTSIGAFVGAFFADQQLDFIDAFVRELSWKEVLRFFDVQVPTRGLLDGSRIHRLLTEQVRHNAIEQMAVPFCAVATDLHSGREVRFTTGPVVEAVRASISIPGILTPVFHEGTILVDGGLVNPVPVSAARKMGAEVVIAVDLNAELLYPQTRHKKNTTSSKPDAFSQPPDLSPCRKPATPSGTLRRLKKTFREFEATVNGKIMEWRTQPEDPNIFEVVGKSLDIVEFQVTQTNLQLHPPEILLQPSLGHLGLFDFHEAESTILEGYQTTIAAIPRIREAVFGTTRLHTRQPLTGEAR